MAGTCLSFMSTVCGLRTSSVGSPSAMFTVSATTVTSPWLRRLLAAKMAHSRWLISQQDSAVETNATLLFNEKKTHHFLSLSLSEKQNTASRIIVVCILLQTMYFVEIQEKEKKIIALLARFELTRNS